jgi:hypothetical protein
MMDGKEVTRAIFLVAEFCHHWVTNTFSCLICNIYVVSDFKYSF